MKKISTLLLATTIMSANAWGVVTKTDFTTVKEFESKTFPKVVQMIRDHVVEEHKHTALSQAYNQYASKKTSAEGLKAMLDIIVDGLIDTDNMPREYEAFGEELSKKLRSSEARKEQLFQSLKAERESSGIFDLDAQLKAKNLIKSEMQAALKSGERRKILLSNGKPLEKDTQLSQHSEIHKSEERRYQSPESANDKMTYQEQIIIGVGKVSQKYWSEISPTFAESDLTTIYLSQEYGEEKFQKITAEVAKTLPGISSGIEKWIKLKDESIFIELLTSHSDEWKKVDHVIYHTLEDLAQFEGYIRAEMKRVDASSAKPEISDEVIQQIRDLVPIVQLPRTKYILVNQYDYLIDYIIAQAYGQEAEAQAYGQEAQKIVADIRESLEKAPEQAKGDLDTKINTLANKANKTAEETSALAGLKVQMKVLEEGAEIIKAENIKKEGVVGRDATESVAEVSSRVIEQASEALSSRMMATSLGIGLASGSEDGVKFGPWAQGFFGTASQKLRAVKAKNTNPFELTNFGALIGCDIEISEVASAGVAGIFSRANVQFYKGNKLSDKATIFNNFGGMIYGQFMPAERISLDAQASFVVNKLTLEGGSEKAARIGFAGINAKYYLPVGSFVIAPKLGFSGLIGSYDKDSDNVKNNEINGDISKMSVNLGLGLQKTISTADMNFTPEMHIGGNYRISGNVTDISDLPKGFEIAANDIKNLDMADRITLGIGTSMNLKKSESFDVTFGIDAIATATHLGTKLGLEALKQFEGDFYSVNGYLKIKLSL